MFVRPPQFPSWTILRESRMCVSCSQRTWTTLLCLQTSKRSCCHSWRCFTMCSVWRMETEGRQMSSKFKLPLMVHHQGRNPSDASHLQCVRRWHSSSIRCKKRQSSSPPTVLGQERKAMACAYVLLPFCQCRDQGRSIPPTPD